MTPPHCGSNAKLVSLCAAPSNRGILRKFSCTHWLLETTRTDRDLSCVFFALYPEVAPNIAEKHSGDIV
jgi:hypothetical protein